MLDQCVVVDTTENENEIFVYSPLLEEELIVKADEAWMEIINESSEQIFVTVDLEKKKVVEE